MITPGLNLLYLTLHIISFQYFVSYCQLVCGPERTNALGSNVDLNLWCLRDWPISLWSDCLYIDFSNDFFLHTRTVRPTGIHLSVSPLATYESRDCIKRSGVISCHLSTWLLEWNGVQGLFRYNKTIFGAHSHSSPFSTISKIGVEKTKRELQMVGKGVRKPKSRYSSSYWAPVFSCREARYSYAAKIKIWGGCISPR